MNLKTKTSALFCCPSCNYETIVYATSEFVRFYTIEFCPECNTLNRKKYYPELVLLSGEEDSYAWAHLPQEISYCDHCTPNKLIPWTELQLLCPVCKQGKMMFKLHRNFHHNIIIEKFKRGWESTVISEIKK